MFRKFSRAMARNDLGQNFLLHKTPRPIACRALFICEKFFDAVIIQRSHYRERLMRASLTVARRKHNAATFRPTLLTSPDKSSYFVVGNPVAFQALKPPAM